MVIGHVPNVKYVFSNNVIQFIVLCFVSKIIQSSTYTGNVLINEFHTMLKYAVRRMKSHPQVSLNSHINQCCCFFFFLSKAAPFVRPVDLKQVPDYLDYIIHPIDLETIEQNINSKKYTSIDGFIADCKWLIHNSVIFNGSK